MAPAVMFTGESGLERRSQENHSSLIYNTTVMQQCYIQCERGKRGSRDPRKGIQTFVTLHLTLLLYNSCRLTKEGLQEGLYRRKHAVGIFEAKLEHKQKQKESGLHQLRSSTIQQ